MATPLFERNDHYKLYNFNKELHQRYRQKTNNHIKSNYFLTITPLVRVLIYNYSSIVLL